jgi:hypothetical protein
MSHPAPLKSSSNSHRPSQGDYHMFFDGGEEKIGNFLFTTVKKHVKGDFSRVKKFGMIHN